MCKYVYFCRKKEMVGKNDWRRINMENEFHIFWRFCRERENECVCVCSWV